MNDHCCVVLCLGFVTKTVLIVQHGLVIAEQCLHITKGISVSHAAPPVSRLGRTRSWKGTQPGLLTPADQRDIPYHMTSCSAIKAGGRRRKEGHSELRSLSSQVTVMRDEALLSWKRPGTCVCVYIYIYTHTYIYIYINKISFKRRIDVSQIP